MAFVLFFMGSLTVVIATRNSVNRNGADDPRGPEFNERQWRAVYLLAELLTVAWGIGVSYKFGLLVE